MSARTLFPVDDPYQARVLVGYLAEAFNPRSTGRDIPPADNPLWPIACRMVEAMGRDNYRIAALASEGRYGPRAAAAGRSVSVVRQRMTPDSVS